MNCEFPLLRAFPQKCSRRAVVAVQGFAGFCAWACAQHANGHKVYWPQDRNWRRRLKRKEASK